MHCEPSRKPRDALLSTRADGDASNKTFAVTIATVTLIVRQVMVDLILRSPIGGGTRFDCLRKP